MFENHQTDARTKPLPDVSPTMGSERNAQPSNNNPLVVTGLDLYNQSETGGVSMPVTAAASDPHHVPCVGMKYLASEKSREPTSVECAQALATCPDAAVALAVRAPCIAFDANLSQNPVYDDDAADTLAVCHKVATAIRTAQTGANGCGISNEAAHTLDRAEGRAVAAGISFDGRKEAPPFVLECSHTETLGTNPGYKIGVMDGRGGEYVVRRLTPRECERLQGFPDDWTRIPYRGKPAEECPDGPRYKAMGNSWGTNCAEWILRRLLAARPVWHKDRIETKGKHESEC